jgi:transcriptional regulator with XRE-family HTH domain
MQAAEAGLLEALEERRRALGLSHNQFAVLLGCSPTHWSRVRRHLRRVSAGFARRVSRQWPDLRASAVAACLGEGQEDRPARRVHQLSARR